jgi:hypothetical protein
MSRERISPIIVIFCTGLMAEFILPWAVIWLSNVFFFDIPGWSPWLLFGGPPALSLLAMLIHWGQCHVNIGRRNRANGNRGPSIMRRVGRTSPGAGF